jgi:hypothetical protein
VVDAVLPKALSSEPGKVFSYKLTSIEEVAGKLVQHGCGPNFQGGRITLCTCMRFHRTWPSIGEGTWIAGFSDYSSGNNLFYLMRVAHTVDSFDAMWRSGYIPDLAAKSAHRHVFGDLYEPVSMKASAYPYNSAYYKLPIDEHKHIHGGEWKRDIAFRHWSTGNRPKLLIGEPGKSFIWERPRHRYKRRAHPRFRLHDSLADFLGTLATK